MLKLCWNYAETINSKFFFGIYIHLTRHPVARNDKEIPLFLIKTGYFTVVDTVAGRIATDIKWKL